MINFQFLCFVTTFMPYSGHDWSFWNRSLVASTEGDKTVLFHGMPSKDTTTHLSAVEKVLALIPFGDVNNNKIPIKLMKTSCRHFPHPNFQVFVANLPLSEYHWILNQCNSKSELLVGSPARSYCSLDVFTLTFENSLLFVHVFILCLCCASICQKHFHSQSN